MEGYTGEPYLRFQPDGTVERNRLSTATYLNDDRQGKVDPPADVTAAGPDAEPEWEVVADGGTYAWHDHRVHWMDDSSPSVDRGEPVPGAYDPWRVPIVVDGASAEIQGILVYEESVSPLPYLGLAVIVAGLLGLLRARSGLRASAASLAGGVGLAAVVVGWADYASTPDGGGNPLHWALAAVALGDRDRRGRARPPRGRRRPDPRQRGRAVGLGALPHRGPLQARAADRAPCTRSTARSSRSPSG